MEADVRRCDLPAAVLQQSPEPPRLAKHSTFHAHSGVCLTSSCCSSDASCADSGRLDAASKPAMTRCTRRSPSAAGCPPPQSSTIAVSTRPRAASCASTLRGAPAARSACFTACGHGKQRMHTAGTEGAGRTCARTPCLVPNEAHGHPCSQDVDCGAAPDAAAHQRTLQRERHNSAICSRRTPLHSKPCPHLLFACVPTVLCCIGTRVTRLLGGAEALASGTGRRGGPPRVGCSARRRCSLLPRRRASDKPLHNCATRPYVTMSSCMRWPKIEPGACGGKSRRCNAKVHDMQTFAKRRVRTVSKSVWF